MAGMKVTRVIDGDTFEVDGCSRSIRLADFDAPEKGFPGSATATKKLESLVFGKTVEITKKDIDKYDRIVADVSIDGISVNDEMRNFL